VATAAPGADGLVRHWRARAGRQRFGIRRGAPAARPCDAWRTGRPAAAVPVRGTLAGAGTAARPFRPGRPWNPGRAGRRGHARAACGIRSYPAVGARAAPLLGRTVRPGPRPEPGIGTRAKPGLRTATGPGIWSWSRPTGAWAGSRDGTTRRTRIEARIAGRAHQLVQAGVPARAGPAGHACVTAKARVTGCACAAAVTWVSAAAWVRAGTEVTAPGRLVPSAGIGCPAIRGRILIGDGGGHAPARVPRALRTAVAHAPSPVPGHLAGCRRDLLEVTPS
jgi:hypothetical protein